MIFFLFSFPGTSTLDVEHCYNPNMLLCWFVNQQKEDKNIMLLMRADFFCRNTGIRKKDSSPHLLRCPSLLPRCCFWCCRTPRLCSGCLGSDWARGGPSGSAHAELTSEGSLAGRGIPWTGAQRGAQTDPTCTCERREGTHGVRLIMITEMLLLVLFVC